MKLLQASPVCGARAENISLLFGFYPDQNTKYLPLVSRAFSGSSECPTWAVLLTCPRYFGECSPVKRRRFGGTRSAAAFATLGAAAASRAPPRTRSHARAAAPHRLGKGGTAELALDNLKFKIILTGGAAAQAPFEVLAKQEALSEAAFLVWKRQSPNPQQPRSRATASPKILLRRGKGRDRSGPGVSRLAAFSSWQAALPEVSLPHLAEQAPSPPARATEFSKKKKKKICF